MTTQQYETTDGTAPDGEVQHEPRTIRRNLEGGEVHMMTEIGDGVFVQWSQCAACSKHVTDCSCPTGPKEPDYMARWRTQRFAKSFAERGIEPRATPWAIKGLKVQAKAAANAAYGDSNDLEIDLLRDTLEQALDLLGVKMPQGVDPNAEPERPSALEQTLGIKPEPLDEPEASDDENLREHKEHVAERVQDGLDAAIAAARESKEEQA